MPAPTVIFESSAATSGTGAISVSRPAAGVGQAGDLELLFVESANQAVSTPSGFSILPNAPVGIGTAAATTATRLSIFYRFNTGETGTISVADPGDHVVATLVTLRGVDEAQPFGSTMATFSNATAGTSHSSTGLDVYTDSASILFAVVADQIDSTSSQGIVPNATFQNGNTYSWIEKSFRTISGNGGGITYRTAVVEDPAANHLTGVSITSTGSIIPCAIYFYVRGCRSGSADIFNRSRIVTEHTATDADPTVFPSITGEASTDLFAGTTSVTVTRLANTKSGCIEFLVAEYPSGDLYVPDGWSHVPGSPVSNPNFSTTLATTLCVLWRVSDGDLSSIVLTSPGDHILALHAILFNVDESDPFVFGLGGMASFAGELNSSAFASIETYPGIPVEFADGTNFAQISFCSNSVDSTIGNQASSCVNVINGNYDYFYNNEIVLDVSLQSTSGNGGGLGIFSASYTTGEYDGNVSYKKIGFPALEVYREAEATAGVAALSLIVRNKTGHNLRLGCANDFLLTETLSIEHSSAVVVNHAEVETFVLETVVVSTTHTAIKQYAYRDALISELAAVSATSVCGKVLLDTVSISSTIEIIESHEISGPSYPAEILLLESVFVSGERRASRAVVFDEAYSDVAIFGEKGAKVFFESTAVSTIFADKLRTAIGSLSLIAESSVVGLQEKGAMAEVVVFEDCILVSSLFKTASRLVLIELASSASSLGRLVTTFEYGDIVVIDLRAMPVEVEQSCVRSSPVIEVRRGEDFEFSAVRAEFEAPGRRRYEDIVGEQVRLLGKEIVCVREVFNEGE